MAMLQSGIRATDASIESASAITVTRYDSSYTHTITYEFGSEKGTIATGSTDTSISWVVPSSFYKQIPNARTGNCTLTCETFSGNKSLGFSTCRITVTATYDKCKPSIVANVVDTNDNTKALTGDDSKLIRYMSTALCTLTAKPHNSAKISSLSIAGSTVKGTLSGSETTAEKSYSSVSTGSFRFIADDSRGYRSEVTITPEMIPYKKLSCNPLFSRTTPTSNEILMTLTGDVYTGSFGGDHNNTLNLEYRYREDRDGEYYCPWRPVESTNIKSYTDTDTYRSISTISLDDDDKPSYQKDYVFQVRATDGCKVGETDHILSTVVKTVTVSRGIPVFDWGENDFQFHVPVWIPRFLVGTGSQGDCANADTDMAPGTYRLTENSANCPIKSGILVVFSMDSNNGLQLAVNPSGNTRRLRVILDGTAGSWVEI